MSVSAANEITHSPERQTKRQKRAYQNDEAESLLWTAPVSGAFADTRKISFAAKAPSSRWIAAVSAAEEILSRKGRREHKVMEGGNGANIVSEVTLWRATGVNPWV